MSKVSYYTEEGLKKLREELNKLKDIERPKASQAIAEARDKVISVKMQNMMLQKKLKECLKCKLQNLKIH